MTEPKTKPTKQSIAAFLKTIEPGTKRDDTALLVSLFAKITGQKPVMWGTSIVGYGTFHYKSKSSEGDWMRTGFSPRKANFSLYILEWQGKPSPLLKKLGKYKLGGGCLYINKLADIDLNVLALLIEESYNRKHRNETTKQKLQTVGKSTETKNPPLFLQKTMKETRSCSRGHAYKKTRVLPVCPKCWPGYYKKMLPRKK